MHARNPRQFGLARIDDHQVGLSAQHLLADTGADDRVALERVGADHEDGAGLLDVVEAVGGGARPQHRLERLGARRVADPRATVDVVCAEDDPRELLGEIVLLVRGARGAEDADRLWPMVITNPL
jgi:hypothetical protein